MRTITTLAVLAAFLVSSACAGLRAREDVLIPAMRTAWVGICSTVVRFTG